MISDDLNRMIRPAPPEKKLDSAAPPAAIREKTGLSEPATGSVSSPITETVRTHYTERNAVSSDGVFTVVYKPIKKLTCRDAKGGPVVFDFIDPP